MQCKSVKGVRLPDVSGRDDETGLWDKPPGSWRWRLNGYAGDRVLEGVLPSKYPDGPGVVHPYQMCYCVVCGSTSMLPVWEWDGNVESPTLLPSILVDTVWGEKNQRVFWHGHMVNGNFVACE